jgi:hypothetical protein
MTSKRRKMTSPLTRLFAIFAVLLAGASVLARAEDNVRTTISRETILGALHSSGMQIVANQIEQLSGVTAQVPNPLLRVLSIDAMDAESDKVLMRCESPNTCLPFYVLVHWPQNIRKSAVRPGRQDETLSQLEAQAASILVRSGKFVMLVLNGEYIHMTLPVLCLQNGGRGQQVSVINKATKKRYLARVTGPGVVTSVLQE